MGAGNSVPGGITLTLVSGRAAAGSGKRNWATLRNNPGSDAAGHTSRRRAIDIIQRLYRIERASKDASEDADARLARRREFSAPLLDELDAWLARHDGRHEPKSPLGKAITYLKGQRGALGVFLLDGRRLLR